jgi:hypothetical protein
MTLHLTKLCVGADSVEDLAAWIDERLAAKRADGRPAEQIHTTRMMPKRRDEILDGGSLYWVIKGVMQVRQRLVDIRPVVGKDGVPRCDLVFEPRLVLTERRPCRPFQGWRYLAAGDAPRDIDRREEAGGPPGEMRAALAELGLL